MEVTSEAKFNIDQLATYLDYAEEIINRQLVTRLADEILKHLTVEKDYSHPQEVKYVAKAFFLTEEQYNEYQRLKKKQNVEIMNKLTDKWSKMGMLENLEEGDKLTLATLLEKCVERYSKDLVNADESLVSFVGWGIPIVSRLFRKGKVTQFYHIDFEFLESKYKMYKDSVKDYSVYLDEEVFIGLVVDCYKPLTKFKVGDKAYKPKGYKFPCTIVSVFTTVEGKIRVVAEMDEYGMLHIFNEEQLEHL